MTAIDSRFFDALYRCRRQRASARRRKRAHRFAGAVDHRAALQPWAWRRRWSAAPDSAFIHATLYATCQRSAAPRMSSSMRCARLHPTHVIVNVDENDLATFKKIQEFVPHVIVTHPNAPARQHCAVPDARAECSMLKNALSNSSRNCSASSTACHATAWQAERVLYLIWKDPVDGSGFRHLHRANAGVRGWNVTIAPGGWSGAARYPVVSGYRSRGAQRSTECCCHPSLSCFANDMLPSCTISSTSRSI